MFVPLGFRQHSINTSLGKMAYYTNEASPWDIQAQETLVFFHGFGGGSSAYEWSKVYPAFAAQYRVLAPDLIGWGRSDHPERNYRIEDYVTVLNEFLDWCGSAKVIASGLTAAFTIRAAIARPDLYKSLFLTTAAGLSDFGENYTRNFFTQLVSTPILDRVFYGAGVATSFGIRNFLERNQFAHPERIYPEIVEAYLQSAQQPNAEYAALAFVRGDLCFDLSKYITQLKVPTMIVWGEKSEFTGPEVGRKLAAMNPQFVRFQQIDDVGLTPQLELPAVTIGLIYRFLSELEQTEQTSITKYAEFIQTVQQLDFISQPDHADAAVKTVLGILASRLTESQAQHLTQKLPEPLNVDLLRGHQESDLSFSAEQFLEEISTQLEIEKAQAEALVNTVFQLTKETIGTETLKELTEFLPSDWSEMMQAA